MIDVISGINKKARVSKIASRIRNTSGITRIIIMCKPRIHTIGTYDYIKEDFPDVGVTYVIVPEISLKWLKEYFTMLTKFGLDLSSTLLILDNFYSIDTKKSECLLELAYEKSEAEHKFDKPIKVGLRQFRKVIFDVPSISYNLSITKRYINDFVKSDGVTLYSCQIVSK